jgi:hypothetical protein
MNDHRARYAVIFETTVAMYSDSIAEALEKAAILADDLRANKQVGLVYIAVLLGDDATFYTQY